MGNRWGCKSFATHTLQAMPVQDFMHIEHYNLHFGCQLKVLEAANEMDDSKQLPVRCFRLEIYDRCCI